MDVIRFSEQLLASAVGSSSARLILSLLFRRHDRESRDAFRLLDDATEALQHNRDLLQIALDQMEQGITVFDRDFRLICWNRQYRALFDLPDEMGQVGVSLDQILRHLAERGDIPRRPARDDAQPADQLRQPLADGAEDQRPHPGAALQPDAGRRHRRHLCRHFRRASSRIWR